MLPYLKYFTWLKQAEIAELQSALEEHVRNSGKRNARWQKK
ncbi:MAG: hypothetical protein R3C26_22115 [Calditrichia bacterium]